MPPSKRCQHSKADMWGDMSDHDVDEAFSSLVGSSHCVIKGFFALESLPQAADLLHRHRRVEI